MDSEELSLLAAAVVFVKAAVRVAIHMEFYPTAYWYKLMKRPQRNLSRFTLLIPITIR